MIVEKKDESHKKASAGSSQHLSYYECGQRISHNGRIKVSKLGWTVRIITMAAYLGLVIYIIYEGIRFADALVLYSFIMPLSSFLVVFFGWVFYRNPVPKNSVLGSGELVSIIVPVYNQEAMIEQVIESLYASTYRPIEVVVVNDGSKDGTKQILDKLAKSSAYPNLHIIHKKNGGKRRAVAAGFYFSHGKYVVMIDSDSIIDQYAIEEIVRTFDADPKTGGVVGHIKVVNSGKNLLTKIQDVWYDYSFNVSKSAESYFGNVICLSGCLAGYRREAIESFLPYWANTPGQKAGEDKELTMYVIAPGAVKTELRKIFGNKFWVPMSQKLMESMAKYDDSEDRALTAHSLITWKNVYVASAVGYTEAPESFKKFCKQQIRWKKSFVRTNFFLNSFFWRKHPVIAFHYYILFMSTMIAPFVTTIHLFYIPFVLGDWFWTLSMLALNMVAAFGQGLDYRFRDPTTKHWLFKPLSLLFTTHIVTWLLIPALIGYRKNTWGTR